ncbi:dnaJ homolog subfamily C member 13-like [Paramacrobiotus metropolitanus]|uniref:dnaJ homolog subfamily C member 13-like n=1 Tax=Paramacrobiotus metropolitanus TaxID=2943436 RepID=UPI0024461E2C|nr:dnaJ homolog subfamily C member 13-like [Paramacrobiotus metropolitanus]XP_055340831.1 dnaJ homolog subfamily C member 13-like [Paramacrobiotus metropolitanus]
MAETPLRDNKDLCCYFVTKHSWKGKYKRVFSVGTKGITTYNPGSCENTNQWAYNDIVSIAPATKGHGGAELTLTVRKGKKIDTLKFSSDHRTDILTECQRFRHLFHETSKSRPKYNAYKHHWSDNRIPATLEIGYSGLHQVDPATGVQRSVYDYKDIEAIALVSDYPGGFCIFTGGFERLHMFASESRDAVIRDISEAASQYIGLHLTARKEPINFDRFSTERFGKYSTDEALTSLSEFVVQKITTKSSTGAVKRILCLSESCLLERDPGSYAICTLKPLCDIFAIVRHVDNPQLFSIEYVKGQTRTYASTDRDSLLATIMDGVRAAGNRDIHVKMYPTERGYRLGPFTIPVDEEVESQHLRFLQISPAGMLFSEVVQRFNSNISYSGLLHAVTQDGLFAENKEKLINVALMALVERDMDLDIAKPEDVEAQFQALRRLFASKAGFMAFTNIPTLREKIGSRVIKALSKNNDAITHAVLDMLCALMQPMHDDYDLRQEQINKASLMSSKKFMEGILEVFSTHVQRGSGALIISATLDFLTFALCAPYSETTDGTMFDQMLEMVAARGRTMFKLFQHPSMAIVKGAGLVMKALIEEGEDDVATKMQELAMSEGALPKHLHIALFTQSLDSRVLTNRQLSRILVSLWVSGNESAMSLLSRIMPYGLLYYLESSEEVPEHEIDRIHQRDNLQLAVDIQNKNKGNAQWKVIEKQVSTLLKHWRARIGMENQDEKVQRIVVLRKRRQKIKSESNWDLFYYQFLRDHARANLIWNHKTREELRECLENELRAFNVDKDLGAGNIISWNHIEFEVPYNCLNEEIKIGDYFLRLLLEEGDSDDEASPMNKPKEFFFDLYHRFLLSQKASMKSNCLQAMTIVYGRCSEEIGPFNDTKYMMLMLDKCMDKLERDRLLIFVDKLISNKQNVKDLIDANGIRTLVDLLTLAHFHTNRAVIHTQTNVIEAGADSRRDTEKEWYYGNLEKERLGPVSMAELRELWESGEINQKTRCWAQGMDGWRPLQHVPQLKWILMAGGNGVMNESDLASLVLGMLIKICELYPSRDADNSIIRPLPKAKRLLSDPSCLPHIVQLLLTFDPILVEKVATLLYHVMQDNPVLPRLYLSGCFFFIMMYTGSNLLPIGRFLHYTHTKQAFRSEEVKSSTLLQRSILGPLIPEAMICYLENYGSDKFAEIFLGEFDTPEAIWNSEMRRLMIEKIAVHIADFSPRLQSNARALYQYCPIPTINYVQLENELFCNIYYLRHLCDVRRFPDWPIKEPVKLLKDVLEAWKKEVEKKPPTMSVDDAYDVLGVKKGGKAIDENVIRRAYFALAQKYHPDKNPDGREMFEKVNKAYEFLCSRTGKVSDGPDPQNLLLILQTQCILFSRYSEELHPFKYAGYPMLIQTITMETQDDNLFAKPVPLLATACELVYHTVACSALNAEELRRENGFEILEDAMRRCVDRLSISSKLEDLNVQVCMNIARCFAVAAQFEQCRERLSEMPDVIRDLCRLLYYSHLFRLCCVAVEAVSAFSVDVLLQTQLFKAGVLWHLLLFLFRYDFTLEEGGVERSAETNQQEVSNNLAKLSIVACARLGGYLRGAAFETPENREIRQALCTMLTPYVTKQFQKCSPHELLKILNSNIRTPYLLWDNGTRAELSEYLNSQRDSMQRSGECDPSFGTGFVHSAHSSELIIGDIFIRIYNEQPTFPIEDPKAFIKDLLHYLGSEAQYVHSLMSMPDKKGVKIDAKRISNVEMALEALRNIVRASPGVELQCVGHFKLIFGLLRMDNSAKLQSVALEAISCVVSNKECVVDIANAEVLGNLMPLMHSVPNARPVILEVLHPLVSNSKIVKEMMSKGAPIYLLDMFCNSTNGQVREKTAELFAKMMAEKLNGPKLRLLLAKFLPNIFMDAMRDAPETSVHMFEGAHENPELIWNDEAREKVSGTVKELKERFYEMQARDPNVYWNLPPDYDTIYSNVQGEIVVGGVFLRLFVANPGWILRKPKEFFIDIMDRFLELAAIPSPPGEELELVTTAIVVFLEAQPLMADQVPTFGHVPQIVQLLKNSNDAVVSAAIKVVHQLAKSPVCINSLASVDCINGMKLAMKRNRSVTPLACEALNSIYEDPKDELVSQALSCDLIPFLLNLLGSPLEFIPNPAGIKAHIVKALKSMAKSLTHGEKVTSILNASKIWSEFRDQRHDLFITQSTTAGYLTAGTPGVAGYLTQGSAKTMPDAPPPMEGDYEYHPHQL